MTKLCVSLGLLTFLAFGCAGSSASAPASAHVIEDDAPRECMIYRGDDDAEDPRFAAVALDRFGILLPGTPEAWGSECPSQTGAMVYFGEVALDDGMLSVSLEQVGGPLIEPFDDRAYFGFFSTVMLATRPPTVRSSESLGIEPLPNGHAAWFMRSTLEENGELVQMYSGYAVRQLSGDQLIVAHVSRSGRDVGPEAKEVLISMLRLFGSADELMAPEQPE